MNEKQVKVSIEDGVLTITVDVSENKQPTELNKLAKLIYGEERIRYFDSKIIQKIIDLRACTGKTTAHALKCIVGAMSSPNIPFKIVPENDGRSTGFMKTQFFNEIQHILNKLEFKFFVISPKNETITFEI